MPDYLSCGSCQTDFQLSDITNFIKHKVQHCNDYQDSEKGTATHTWTSNSNSLVLLECTQCLRKFNTPWPLLQHLQTDHRINLMRNILLPSNFEGTYNISTVLRSNDTFSNPNNAQNSAATKINDKKTSSTQTIRSCIKKIVCPYNLPSDCCLKKEIEARIQEGCCSSSTEASCCLRSKECDKRSSCPMTDCCLLTSNTVSKDKDVCCQDRRISSPSQGSVCTPSKASALSRNKSPPCCQPSPPCTRSRSAARKSLFKECCATTRCGVSPACCSDDESNLTELTSNSNKSCEQRRTDGPTSARMPVAFMETKDCQTDFIDTSSFDFDVNMLLEGGFDDSQMGDPQEAFLLGQQPSYLPNHEIRDATAANSIIMNQEMFQSSLDQMGPVGLSSINFQQLNVSDLDNFEMSSEFNMNEKQQQQQTSVSDLLVARLPNGAENSCNPNFLISDGSTLSNRKANISETRSGSSPSTSSRKRYKDYRFSCTDCSKPFKQNVHLKKHIQSQHMKLKPHKCSYCDYTTVEKSHLTVHIRTHTGEKPFRCRLCSYSTAQNCTLKSHYLRRHPGVTLLCKHCQECFITEHEKDKHEKMCHDMNLNAGQVLDVYEQSGYASMLQKSSTTCS